MTTDRPTPAAFAGAAWSDVLPRYEALAARPLASGTVETWLADWSALEEALDEAGNLAWIAFTTDTADPVKEGHWIRFAGEIAPRHDEQNVRLADRTFDLGYSRPDLVRRDDWSGIGDNRQVGRSHQLIA